MAIFNSYVKLPEGIWINYDSQILIFMPFWDRFPHHQNQHFEITKITKRHRLTFPSIRMMAMLIDVNNIVEVSKKWKFMVILGGKKTGTLVGLVRPKMMLFFLMATLWMI